MTFNLRVVKKKMMVQLQQWLLEEQLLIIIQWGTGETTSDIFYLSKGQYSLSVSDSKGCTLPIEYFDVSFDGFNGCIEIPSGFTPNNDNIHDEWVIYGLSDFPDVVVKIYNRWGQEIYSSQGYYKSLGWKV